MESSAPHEEKFSRPFSSSWPMGERWAAGRTKATVSFVSRQGPCQTFRYLTRSEEGDVILPFFSFTAETEVSR